MSKEQIRQTRLQLKHDTEENWAKAANFIPKVSEPIIFDADQNYSYPRLKIGDGVRNAMELPFIYIDKGIWDQVQTMSYIDAKEIDDGIVEIRVSALKPSEEVEF